MVHFTTLHNVCAVHWVMFSTLGGIIEYTGGYHEYTGGYHEYTGGYHETLGDTMMSVGAYHEYSGGCSVHWRDTMMRVGDIMSRPGYVQYTGVSIQIQLFSQQPSPTFIMISLSVLMISPSVLNTPQCTDDIPILYSWYPPVYCVPPVYCTDFMQGVYLLTNVLSCPVSCHSCSSLMRFAEHWKLGNLVKWNWQVELSDLFCPFISVWSVIHYIMCGFRPARLLSISHVKRIFRTFCKPCNRNICWTRCKLVSFVKSNFNRYNQ